jgi:hypothetical protein
MLSRDGNFYEVGGPGALRGRPLFPRVAAPALLQGAAPGTQLTFTVIPAGSGLRIGVDRDEDGHLDRDETDAGSDRRSSRIPDPPSPCGRLTDGDR